MLPPEILWQIFLQCSYGTLTELLKTCKIFNNIIEDPSFLNKWSSKPCKSLRNAKILKCESWLDDHSFCFTEINTLSKLQGFIIRYKSSLEINLYKKMLEKSLYKLYPNTEMVRIVLRYMGLHYSKEKYRKLLLRFMDAAPFDAPLMYKTLNADDMYKFDNYYHLIDWKLAERHMFLR